MANRTFGEINGNPVGTTYASRLEASKARVHIQTQAGIAGDKTGAESICVSGGYKDDEDRGDVIIYTGHGGQDSNGRQVSHQELTSTNLGLARCCLEGIPVRVLRGSGGNPQYSPKTGYRYDGLFQVTDYWHEIGRDGFRVWRYRLVQEGSAESTSVEYEPQTQRVETTVQRIVRDTRLADAVKDTHDHTCQVCEMRLWTAAGAYAEAAHIRGLGKPHNGPDVIDNILCLCPNHHVLFDGGGIYIDDAGIVREFPTNEAIGRLRTSPKHPINFEYVRYHRDYHSASM